MTVQADLTAGGRLAFYQLRLLGRGARALLSVVLVLGMLALNVATLTVSSLNALASSAIAAIAGVDTVRTRELRLREAADASHAREQVRAMRAAEVAEAEARALRADKDLLAGRVDAAERRAAGLANEIVELGATNRALSAEIDAERNVTFRGRPVSVRDAMGEVADAVKTRTARAATTNITSIWGESIPLWGIAINVAATGFEMKMACDTMRDMHELELALGGPSDAAEADRVCGFNIPTVGEIRTAVVAAPGQLWTTVTSDVEELTDTEIEAPDRGSAPEEGWFDGWFD